MADCALIIAGANNEDVSDAISDKDIISHAQDSNVARAAEGNGDEPKTHPDRLAPVSGAAVGSHTATATDHLHNRYHRYLSHRHQLQHDHEPHFFLHRSHSKTPPNTSQARTRSASSSISTAPSTFHRTAPLHTAIDGPNSHVIDIATADDTGTPNDVRVSIDALYTGSLNKDKTSLGDQAHTKDPRIHPAPLPATASQHQTLPSTPALASIQNHARRRGERDSGTCQESLSLSQSPIDSQSPLSSKHTGEAGQDLGQAWECESHDDEAILDSREASEFLLSEPAGGTAGDRAFIEGVGINGSEIGSVDSHTLAWDQTRLRIAYLVSTMVTPSADAPVDGAGAGAGATAGATAEAAAGAGHDTKEGARAPPASTGSVPLFACAALADQEAAEIGHYMEQCPKGWNHTELAKKREKVTQILYWQSEVTGLGDDYTFCGCSVGTTTPYDASCNSSSSGGGGGGGFASPPAAPPRSHASSEAAMPRLSTVASGVTTAGTSAAGLDRSSSASPSSSLSAPSSLSSSLSSSPSPGSPSLHSARPCCSGCKKLLMPPRTVVFVSSSSDDFPWVQRAEDGGGCSSSKSGFRKAIRSIRGLIGLSKRKKEKLHQSQNGLYNPDVAKIATSGGGNALFFAVPDLAGVQLVGPASPMPSARTKSMPEAKVWDLWEKTNCHELHDHVEKDEWALFFPATEMYRGLRSGAEEGDAHADADAEIDAIINDAEDDDDDDGHDADAKGQRKKREMAERLRRARVLLEQQR